MKNFLNALKQNRYFLWFIFLFSYVQSVQGRYLVRGKVDAYLFTPEAAVASWIGACILFLIIREVSRRRGSPEVFSFREALAVFSLSFLLYFLLVKGTGLVMALAFGTVERNFNRPVLISSTVSLLLDALIYGSFFITYDYYRKQKRRQEQIREYQQALAESRISHLKNQLNPHFLFNNLNVLDQLIEEDKRKASDFLNEFADIYRYVLQATDSRLVSVEAELSFARKYFGLLQHKYGSAYRLTMEGEENTHGRMVPLTLQLLLENAFRHNFGTEGQPVEITIRLGEEIAVSNTIIRKRNPGTVSGRALVNLREQYRLLSGSEPEIIETEDTFTVTVPRIHDTSDIDRG